MARKFFVGGNWKMNGNKASIDKIIEFLTAGPLDPNCEVVVGCPAIYMDYVRLDYFYCVKIILYCITLDDTLL